MECLGSYRGWSPFSTSIGSRHVRERIILIPHYALEMSSANGRVSISARALSRTTNVCRFRYQHWQTIQDMTLHSEVPGHLISHFHQISLVYEILSWNNVSWLQRKRWWKDVRNTYSFVDFNQIELLMLIGTYSRQNVAFARLMAHWYMEMSYGRLSIYFLRYINLNFDILCTECKLHVALRIFFCAKLWVHYR